MRLNIIYFKSRHHAKAPQNEKKVPFKEIIPLSLKNSVKGSSKNVIENKCLFEMSLLFGCWKENTFNDKICEKFTQNLNDCYKKYLKNSVIQKKLREIDVPAPDSKILTNKQITYLLRMYPNI
ncbi:coiled-coil-helix-coiled-coil-helix domain-containing protein 1 [Apis dorsata]|uniref:coiled-coil-helix-coiled-coil-helix domain-containing protein 1 n=1 Tax=Apis dorsata TaxID=7462 RepID=UPI001293C5A8|nr:coiled-coil-helix-coiled-coil-helix domain-containing protein 1 [Apis dorsata]